MTYGYVNSGFVHSGLKTYAKNKPNDVAVVYNYQSLTYSELYIRVNRLANSLLNLGVKKGNHIAFYMRNRLEMMEAIYATTSIGAVAIPINYMIEGTDFVNLINNSDAKFIFVEVEQLQKFEGVVNQLNFIGPESTIIIGSDTNNTFINYNQLMKESSNDDPVIEINSNDLFAILFSSGTTSIPKGSMITQGQQLYRLLRTAVDLNANHNDVTLITVPIYHSVGFNLIFRTCLLGSRVVITREFNPEKTLELIRDYQVTQSFFVSTQYKAMLQVPRFDQYDLSSLKLLIAGSAPISKETKTTIIEKFKCNLLEFFGSTEAGTYSILYPEHVVRKSASVGQNVSQMEVRLLDHDGKDVEIGEEGEFVVRGPALFNGYYKLPDVTAKSFLPGGWFQTGDMGKMDAEGFYYLLDRKKDMIISGGVNVYPKDIEQVIYTHSAVLEAAVVGIPDEKWGEAAKAYVVLKPGEQVKEWDIIQYANQKLARFQQVKELEFISSLPRNPSGKILKRQLQKR